MLKATMIACGILAGTAATALRTTADDGANDGAVIGSASAATISDFAVCHTPLPANFCTCGRYALFEVESEALWS